MYSHAPNRTPEYPSDFSRTAAAASAERSARNRGPPSQNDQRRKRRAVVPRLPDEGEPLQRFTCRAVALREGGTRQNFSFCFATQPVNVARERSLYVLNGSTSQLVAIATLTDYLARGLACHPAFDY